MLTFFVRWVSGGPPARGEGQKRKAAGRKKLKKGIAGRKNFLYNNTVST